ncbi:MAG: hypothetical protein LBC91_00690, partial [Candidatus Accumulibacter sp.]|nr:hypothetical protein [Accumulibacter sp.]
MRSSVLAVASSLVLAGAPPLAQAAGLGRLVVFSALGQPLRAEIEVTATPQELADMKAQLASPETFKQAGLDYATALLNVRFGLERRPNGQVVVKLFSERPINDPFLDMLLELSWATGRLVREYTFLLDPPEYASRAATPLSYPVLADRPPSTVAAPPFVGSGTPPVASPRAPSASIDDEVRARAIAQVRNEPQLQPPPLGAKQKMDEPGEERTVKRGETLYRIATETKPESVSVDQMLVGLFRANPKAFDGRNMNRLRAGAILSMPQASALESVSTKEARRIVRAQSSDWNAYRNRLADMAAQSAGEDEAAKQESGGKITAKVADGTEPATPKDQLKVSRTESDAKGSGGAASRVSDEDLVAKDKALQEANERIALLEKMVADQKRLLELQSLSLAELQQTLAKRAATGNTPESSTAGEQAKAPAQARVQPKRNAPPPPDEEPGFFEQLLDNVLMLMGGIAVLALGAGYFIWRRRRATDAEPVDMEGGASHSEAEAETGGSENSVFQNTAGGQSVDTSSQIQAPSDFSQVGPGSIDTDEVDPVAEADVYMAYGRDAQAEEILLEARQKDPKRVAITVKLLEVYSLRKDVKQFGALAAELHGETGGVGQDWEKAVAMGHLLDPDNPIFHGDAVNPGAAASAPATAANVPVTPTRTPTPPLSPETVDRGANVAPQAVPSMPASGTPQPVAPPTAAVTRAEPEALDFDIGTKEEAPLVEALDPQEIKEPLPTDIDFDLGGASLTPSGFVDTSSAQEAPAPAEKPALGDDAVEFDVSLSESTFLGRAPSEPPPFDLGSIDLDLHSPELEITGIEEEALPAETAKAPPQRRLDEAAPGKTPATTASAPEIASPGVETVVATAAEADFDMEQTETQRVPEISVPPSEAEI